MILLLELFFWRGGYYYKSFEGVKNKGVYPPSRRTTPEEGVKEGDQKLQIYKCRPPWVEKNK